MEILFTTVINWNKRSLKEVPEDFKNLPTAGSRITTKTLMIFLPQVANKLIFRLLIW